MNTRNNKPNKKKLKQINGNCQICGELICFIGFTCLQFSSINGFVCWLFGMFAPFTTHNRIKKSKKVKHKQPIMDNI